MVERVDQLTAAPEVGRFYLVPAILWAWGGYLSRPKSWWPVIGPKHDDLEFFQFKHKHYHVDPRFLTKRLKAQVYPSRYGSAEQSVLGQPINSVALPEGPPPPVLRKMKCTLRFVDYPFGDTDPVMAINRHYAGQQCDQSKFGWICPHRNVQLGSIMPIGGVITCPFHGMRIDMVSGKCLGVEST